MVGAEASSPVPQHSGQLIVGPSIPGTTPLPRQTVQVNVLIAPVPRQCAQGVWGAAAITFPRPPQTQQFEREDMMSNGSFPVPRQKAQTTSASRDALTASVDGTILFPFSGRRTTTMISARPRSSPGFPGHLGLIAGLALRLQPPTLLLRLPKRMPHAPPRHEPGGSGAREIGREAAS